MKIAITGGAGFIGSHVAKAYLDAGHDVLVIDTFADGGSDGRLLNDARARFYQCDIRDEKLFTLLQNERPDVVSHHVAQRVHRAYPDALQSRLDADVHVRGLLNVLESCVAASVQRVIFASGGNNLYGCAGAAGMTDENEEVVAATVTENTAICPRSPQDISSVAGEWYVRYYAQHYGIKHTILRYADVYGETRGDFVRHPVDYFVSTLLTGRSPIIRGAIDEVHDHIFIDDVVQANLCVLAHGYDQTLHISSSEGHTVRRLYQAVACLLGSEQEPVYISNALVKPSSIVMDNTRARNVLHWQPDVSLMEGIQLTIERMREHVEVPRVAPSLVGAR
ncbi:MAG TPA: NAD-dependent epimerase/dehydratase family protein [Ktedonobacteraceae bacterium]|nr:NAD-dependent epimerase/dehydratase family protein [Ktedonobacteraceae bacterium]